MSKRRAQELQQEWQFFNRTYLASMNSIDPKTGICNIAVGDGLALFRQNLELPTLEMSLSGSLDEENKLADASTSAWRRFMPHQFTLCNVSFGPKSEPKLLNLSHLPNGYAAIIADRDAKPSLYPYELVDLKSGEWDMRSSGGAWIYGSAEGVLLLSANPFTQIKLIREKDEIRGKAGLWNQAGYASQVRLGSIKRLLLPTDYTESDVSTVTTLASETAIYPARLVTAPVNLALDPNSSEEWYLSIQSPPLTPLAPGAPNFLLAEEQLGAVRNYSNGAVETGALPTVPLRWRRTVFPVTATNDIAGRALPSFNASIDANGNVDLTTGDLATFASAAFGALTALSVSANTVEVSGLISNTVDAPIVKLGGSAVEPVLKGLATSTAVVTAFNSLSLALTAASASFTGGTLPVTNAQAAAAFTALASAVTALGAVLNTSLTTAQSTKVKVE